MKADWSWQTTSRNAVQCRGGHNLKKEGRVCTHRVGRPFLSEMASSFLLGGKTVGAVGSGPRIVDPCRPTAMEISAGEQRAGLQMSGRRRRQSGQVAGGGRREWASGRKGSRCGKCGGKTGERGEVWVCEVSEVGILLRGVGH